MTNGWGKALAIRLGFAIAIFIVSAAGIVTAQTRSASAQANEQTLSSIENYAHNASTMSGRIEARVRQVRTLVYITLALTVLCLALSYLALRRRAADQDSAAPGRIDPFAWFREGAALALVRRRQRKLQRAVRDLQGFADQIRDTHKEMSGLLETITAELKDIEKTTKGPSTPARS